MRSFARRIRASLCARLELSTLTRTLLEANWVALGNVLRTSGTADRLCREGHFEAGIVLYERATQLLLQLPGHEHQAMVAWQAANHSEPVADAWFPNDVRLARARLRAAALEKLGDLKRHCAAWLRRLVRCAVCVLALLVLVRGGWGAWQRRGEHELAENASWVVTPAYSEPDRGKVPRVKWFGNHAAYFFHSNNSEPPQLTVDLGSERRIKRVELSNRLDCCFERAAGVELWTSIDGVRFERVGKQEPAEAFRFLSFEFAPRRARYVRLSLPRAEYLHLAELKVFGA